MLEDSAQTWLNSLPAGNINSWLYFEKTFMPNFMSTYKQLGRPRQLSMCVQGPAETDHQYLMR